jgi:branched-chain amino acid aminotransferase
VKDPYQIQIEQTKNSRLSQVDFNNLKFGQIASDHMLIAKYADGGWQETKIVPYGNISLSPSSSFIHYGQSIFEGVKAYRFEDGKINIFRPDRNYERFNKSAKRLMMPEVPKEIFLEGMKKLIELDREWVPKTQDASLYIRPFMFATEACLGVRPATEYTFMIITSPVGAYYNKALRLKVETHYTRAAEGGVGFSKNAGNYALSLYPTALAQEEGYDQLIWTDAKEHKYVEEAGTANLIFRIGDTIITPSSETILEGITRLSILDVARKWGYNVEERKVSVKELMDGIENGTVTDAFAAGTAATLTQIGEIGFEGKNYTLSDTESRDFSNKVLAYLNDLRYGKIEDEFGWNTIIK